MSGSGSPRRGTPVAGWREMPLGDVVRLQRGYDLPARRQRPGKVPVMGSAGQNGWHDTARAEGPGVAIGRSGVGSMGVVSYAPVDYWPHNTVLFVTDFLGNDVRFVYYMLRTIDFSRMDTGAAQKSLNRNVAYLHPVRVPPVATQRRIASILSAYDDLIENNERRIRILEEMARRLYREWFVHFRFPGHERVKLVESAVGRVPEGWEAKRLGEVVELAYGKGLKAADRRGGAVPVYGSGGVVGHHDESMVDAPGIIVGRKGNVGSVFWTEESFHPIDTVFYAVSKLSLHYLYFNLQHQNFVNSDAAVPGLSRPQAYALPMVVPPLSAVEAFTSHVKPMFWQVHILSQQNRNLRQTRDLLLPKLVSGEVDVTKVTMPE